MHQNSFLMRWSKFFITRYRISILILIAILIAGAWGVFNNQRQDFPAIQINYAFVAATYPGASPEDVEQEVLIPIEQAASNIDGADKVRSTAQNSFGSVEVMIAEFDKIDEVTNKLGEELNKINFPEGVEANIMSIDAMGPSIALGLVGKNGEDTDTLLRYASDIRARLETSSPDISRVEIAPANEFETQIVIDATKMSRYGLNFDTVKGMLQSQIVSLPGGTIVSEEGRKEAITVKAPVQTIDDIKNISFGPIKLSDFAEITRLPKQNENIFYIGYVKDGQAYAKESVYLMVYKKDDGDVIRISEAVRAEVDKILEEDALPEEVDLVVGYDSAPFVDDQIGSLINNAWLGLICILIVLLFFINLRTSFVVALIIPITFLITFFVLALVGYTLNILTLFAMILTLGILVDNAIVIAEGMVHELDRGATRKQAALIAVKKLGPAVTAATLTTFVVFIPFARIGGIMGEFLKYIPYTIMIVIAASYFMAISVTPLFGSWILKEETAEQRRQKRIKTWHKILIVPAVVMLGQKMIDKLSNLYALLMRRIYKKLPAKLGILLLVTILMGLSFGYFLPQLEFEQFPSKDGDTMQLNFTFPAGTPFEEKKDVFLKAQNELVQMPYFQNFYFFDNVVYATFAQAKDRPDGKTIHEIEDQLDKALDNVRQEISEDIKITPIATVYGPPEEEFDVIIELLGNDQATLTDATDNLESFLQKKDGVEEIFHGPREALASSIDVDLDQKKLAQAGVNSMVAAGTVNAVFAPQNIGSIVVREDGVSDDLIIEFTKESTDSIDDLKNLFLPSQTRGMVPLSEVAEVKNVENPVSVKRLDGKRVAKVGVKLTPDADRAEINQSIRDYLTEDKLKELGLSEDGVVYGGEYAEFESDYSKLQIVFLLALIAVYLILVYQFYSYLQPALIMFAVPIALIGVFPGLLLVNSTLNMISGLGIIALIGIVVNDAIVFIATYNRYRQEFPDEPIADTLVRSGHTRFKPIFSTSITTIGGILPLTLMDPFWAGLGTSIISGLVFSTIGTLIAIPVLYSVGLSILARIRRKKPEEISG